MHQPDLICYNVRWYFFGARQDYHTSDVQLQVGQTAKLTEVVTAARVVSTCLHSGCAGVEFVTEGSHLRKVYAPLMK
eukprot:6022678-Pleurochrysis_carterae.AAC.1